MKHDERTVDRLYLDGLDAARKLLASLPIAEGREPKATALTGWIYEQTIRFCLGEELRALGLAPQFQEQVPLLGHAKIDLLVGDAAIEVKARGSFGNDSVKYAGYRQTVEARGWTYFYVSRGERYAPYRVACEAALGKDRTYYFDRPNEWARFVTEVAARCSGAGTGALSRGPG